MPEPVVVMVQSLAVVQELRVNASHAATRQTGESHSSGTVASHALLRQVAMRNIGRDGQLAAPYEATRRTTTELHQPVTTRRKARRIPFDSHLKCPLLKG